MRGKPELLRLVASQNRANCDAILTWEGQVELTQRHVSKVAGRSCDLTTRTKVQFAYDRVAGKSMFVATQEQKIGTKQGQAVNDSGRMVWGGIRTRDAFYEVPEWYEDRRKGEPRRPEMWLGTRSTERPGDFSTHFDPFWYLRMFHADVHDRLTFLLENAAAKAMSNSSVSRDGNRVTLILGEPPDATNRFVFDLGQGANVVVLGGADPLIRENHTRSFEQVQGIWVPKTATSENTNLKTGERYERRLTWLRNVLNQPLPAGRFSPEQIALRQGDVVHDRRSGIEYKYDGPTHAAKLLGAVRSQPALIVIALVLSATATVLAGLLIRRRRKKGFHHDASASA